MALKVIPDTRAVARKGNQSVHAQTKSEKERAVLLPSTLRALQLRNAKGGGQLTKISGREKMEQIAEDEMMKAKEARKQAFSDSAQGAVRAPFNMEVAKKVAQSQMDAYIDIINHLHQSDLCYNIFSMELQAQCPPRINPKDADLLKSASFVADQFGILVHNSYMLASGWTIVYESLKYLENLGLEDKMVLQQLKSNNQLRTVYLLAFNLIKKLANASQQRLRSIVQNTEHYHKYFKASTDAKGHMSFDIAELRDLNKSYLDSAIVELCLPGSEYSPQALYHILNTVEQETPRELKRCPQIMWDTVGDLAEAVRLLDMVEMPLLAADGEIQMTEDLGEYAEFVQWEEAQEKSIKAALEISPFVNHVFPITNLKTQRALDKIWEKIEANYLKETGKKIDALWQLIDVRHRIPHFTVLYVPPEVLSNEIERGTAEQPRKKPLAITQNGEEDYDSGDSMPGLLEVSDSEDEEVDDDYLSDTDQDDDSDGDDDDDFDEEDGGDFDEEEDLRKQYRQAMNIFAEMPEIFDLPPDSTDKYAKERKNNPFLNLLGKLRGRMFSSSSALRTDGKTTTSKAKKPAAKPKPATEKPADTQSKKATVEDADDESDEGQKDKKKKKKKPKKKKKTTTETNESAETPTSPTPAQTPLRAETNTPSSPSSPKIDKKQASAPKAPSVHSGLSGTTAFGSTISLLPAEHKAESARKYLAEVGLDQIKSKVKTRPEHDPEPKEGRKRLFNRFGSGPKEAEEKDSKESYNAIFGRLKNKTSAIARKVFGASAQDKKGNVKWEQFLQVMRELGFSYDPSTAGSSVRFDPPNPNDRSVTFHKPHPDPTLYQYRLRDIRAKLRDYYGFTFQQFDDAVNHIGKMGVDSDEN